jgi:RNA polymerase sigma-70 factor (ECF subfamily)
VHEESDEITLERFRRGERNAFDALYVRYRGRLYAYCFRLLQRSDDAEDAVHETFVKLHSGIGSLKHDGAFRTWLYRVARNESFMMIRRIHGRTTVNPDDLWDDTTPLQTLVEKDQTELVRHALGMLKVDYRDVLILREYDGLSYAEIAEVTETTVDSVKARIFKARRALADKLARCFDERITT